jgi:peptidoglycan/LPS O-acetylase OafA/YrhL
MGRLSFLDAIRGIAAFIVVCSHIHFTIPAQADWMTDRGFRILNASEFAVSIFFVLSGFVLFLQVFETRPGYFQFVVRRFFRLFPALLTAVTASYAIYSLWGPLAVPSLGPWFNDVSWPAGITFNDYLLHLPLNGGGDALLRPIWSLVYEWRISLVFPLAVLLFRRSPLIVMVVSILVSYLMTNNLEWLTNGNTFEWATYARTVFYLSFFVGGMALARWRSQIIFWLRRFWPIRSLILLVCVYYVCFRSGGHGMAGWFQTEIIAILSIIFCMSHPKARSILRSAPLQYLGRISYSLYLVHMIWIGVLFRVMDGSSPLYISATVIGLSIASADVMNRFIEQPANRLGRMLSSRISWPLAVPITVR